MWDVSSASIVKGLEGYKGQIRDIFSSGVSNTVVSAFFRKPVKVWLNDM